MSDIEADWMTPDSQGVGIMGTIALPSTVSPGRSTELSLEKAGPDVGGTQYIRSYVTEAGKLAVTYHIKLIQDGNYYLRFGVDQSGNGSMGDSGDLDGFFDGTAYLLQKTRPRLSLFRTRSTSPAGTRRDA
jgi:hypothetical protein